MPYVLALDAGTTSTRALLFDEAGTIRGVAQAEFTQSFPQSGWVEHDPEEIWSTQRAVASKTIRAAGIVPRDVAAIGIANQRETTVVWDRATGIPIHPAIVWQDRRTSPECDQMRADGLEDFVRERTGLVLDAYFSATKIAWLLDHVPNARTRAERGELAFGTIETWLLWKLSAGRIHATDATNASRTLLFNLQSGAWDDELLHTFRVPHALLPAIVPSSGVVATTGEFGAEIPIAGLAGDQQAALIGQLCLAPGQTKTTYGTGCFLLQNTGAAAVASRHRLLTTVGYQIGSQTAFALEGSVFVGGAVVQWLRDGLGLVACSDDVGPLAASVPDNGGVYLVPAFVGLGAPYWDSSARGLLIGLTRGTTQAHVARAALESIAFQVADLLDAVVADSRLPLPEMLVDGGAAKNDLLMQIQADLLGVPLVRPANVETTAFGAALLAGLAAGVWKDVNSLAGLRFVDRRFEPTMPADVVKELRSRWRDAVERSRGWASR